MLTHIRRLSSVACTLFVMTACDGSSPTVNNNHLTFVGRLERGATVQVVAYTQSDTVSGATLSLTATPADAATIEDDGSITFLRSGSLTVQARLPNGTVVSGTTTVAVPPSIVFDLIVEGKRAIYRAALDGEEFSRLSATNGTNVHPSAVGNTVVFTSFRNGQSDVYAVSLTDLTERRVTFLAGNESEPALSADGQRIAFVRDSGGIGRVWVASSTDGSGPRRLTSSVSPSPEAAPAWSTDGRLLFTSTEGASADLSLASQSIPAVITLFAAANTREAEVEGAWSMDGKQVAFVSTRTGIPLLHVLDVLSGQVTSIPDAGTSIAQPAWLADGRIVFATFQAGSWKLAWVDPAAPTVVRVIPMSGRNPQNPTAIR